MKKKFNKEEFKRRFIQYFCNHEWVTKYIDHDRILHVCQKCGKTMDEVTMLEKEMRIDKW